MKRDWMQTGVKPSGICGAALYIAALCHGIKCPKTDIATIVHTCEATIVKRLVEFCHTESASLNVDELTERETLPRKRSSIVTPYSDKERVFCKHQADGLCLSCFIELAGGLVGGSDPPAFQRAEK